MDQLRAENALLRNALEDAGINADHIPVAPAHTNGHSHSDLYGDEGINELHHTIMLGDGTMAPAKKRKRVEGVNGGELGMS